jgi:hypothetical protein
MAAFAFAGYLFLCGSMIAAAAQNGSTTRSKPFSDSAKKGGEAREVIDRNHRYLVVDFALVDPHVNPVLLKIFFKKFFGR